jgi:hypothetical protein
MLHCLHLSHLLLLRLHWQQHWLLMWQQPLHYLQHWLQKLQQQWRLSQPMMPMLQQHLLM